jgi:hypothetical protein
MKPEFGPTHQAGRLPGDRRPTLVCQHAAASAVAFQHAGTAAEFRLLFCPREVPRCLAGSF